MKLAIISDDLTGALDASVPFAAAGLRTVVAVVPERFMAAMDSGADVVAVSTNSREGKRALAAFKSASAAALVPTGVPIFKKVDSRLKGHVRTEIIAVAKAVSARNLILCPAIPAMGRMVKDGMLQGFGIATPVNCHDIIGPDFAKDGLKLDLADAQSDADLDNIVAMAPAGTMFCGARGLASALARAMGKNEVSGDFGRYTLGHPMLFAIGSTDPITLAQVDALKAFQPDIGVQCARNGKLPAGIELAGDSIIQCVEGDIAENSAVVTADFAKTIAHHAALGQGSIVLTGGETAAAVLARMGISLVEIVGEPLPGMPASLPLDGAVAPVIVTKSGGFGEVDSLIKLSLGHPILNGHVS